MKEKKVKEIIQMNKKRVVAPLLMKITQSKNESSSLHYV